MCRHLIGSLRGESILAKMTRDCPLPLLAIDCGPRRAGTLRRPLRGTGTYGMPGVR